eukprot:3912052-Amphidinium_carterae.1
MVWCSLMQGRSNERGHPNFIKSCLVVLDCPTGIVGARKVPFAPPSSTLLMIYLFPLCIPSYPSLTLYKNIVLGRLYTHLRRHSSGIGS